jgi:hypothetical protein
MNKVPAKVILVHGTWGRGFAPEDQAPREALHNRTALRWFEADSEFSVALLSGLPGILRPTDISAFIWSGANSVEQRRIAALDLAKVIDDSVTAAPDVPIFIIAHSHGGNVALDARRKISVKAHNLHVLTIATPFLYIRKGAPRITDRIFTICISIGFVAFLSYLIDQSRIDVVSHILALFVASYLVSFASIVVGMATVVSSLRRAIQKREPIDSPLRKALNVARRVSNPALLVTGVLLVILLQRFPLDIALLISPFSLSATLVFCLLNKLVGGFLYGGRRWTTGDHWEIPNLLILRSNYDEASLALFFGKIASLLTRAASAISIIVPILAMLVALILLFAAIFSAVSQFLSYQECTANGKNCIIQGELVLWILMHTWEIGGSAVRYLAFGFFFSATLIFLAAGFKSLFGRELFYGSLNAIVSAYHTPDGSESYTVHWCAHKKYNALGLRHSLYNNPDALKKIVAHIKGICSSCAKEEHLPALVPHREPSRSGIWLAVTAFTGVAVAYAIIVAIVYAPAGATSMSCKLSSLFEPSGPKGGFTILVAHLENDVGGVGDRLSEEIRRRYDFNIIKTCLQVTPDAEGRSSTERLSTDYNSDLILWGKVTGSEQIELHVTPRNGEPEMDEPFVLAPVGISNFVNKQLQRYLIYALIDSARAFSSSEQASNLSEYANHADAFVQKVDWNTESSGHMADGAAILWEKMEANAAVGKLMLAAALASREGARIEKAISYFRNASAIFDGSGKDKGGVLRDDREDTYKLALLSDARLNRAENSARLAASLYLKDYEEASENIGVSNYQLQRYAEVAASAFFELSLITHSHEAASSAIRLGCESLLRLRYYQMDREEEEKRDAGLLKKGITPGILPEAPIPQNTDAFKILARLGKDATVIFAPGPEMELNACKAF